jgi:hypothetical protein
MELVSYQLHSMTYKNYTFRTHLFTMALQKITLPHQGCHKNVSQISRKKQSVKSKKGLVSTTSKRASDGKEVLRVVQYDDKIRELVVPSQKPTLHPILLDTDEFNRLKQQARVNIKASSLCYLHNNRLVHLLIT